jgi:hypothetical protein
MDFPEEAIEIVKDVVERSRTGDIDRQAAAALKRLKAWEGYPEMVETLVREGVYALVGRQRKRINHGVRTQAGSYGHGSMVHNKTSESVAAAVKKTIFDTYHMGSKWLGDMTREELLRVRDGEAARARTAGFHVELTDWLIEQLPEEGMVREHLKAGEVQKEFDRLRKKYEPPADAAA